METTEIFTDNEGRVVRIPDHLRFATDTVYIQKIGAALVLTPAAEIWDAVFEARALVCDDFMVTRDQPRWPERHWPD